MPNDLGIVASSQNGPALQTGAPDASNASVASLTDACEPSSANIAQEIISVFADGIAYLDYALTKPLSAQDLTDAREAKLMRSWKNKRQADHATLGVSYAVRHTKRSWQQADVLGVAKHAGQMGVCAVGLGLCIVTYVPFLALGASSAEVKFKRRSPEGVREYIAQRSVLALEKDLSKRTRNLEDYLVMKDVDAATLSATFGALRKHCTALEKRVQEDACPRIAKSLLLKHEIERLDKLLVKRAAVASAYLKKSLAAVPRATEGKQRGRGIGAETGACGVMSQA